MIWLIWGVGLDKIEIQASSFDEALDIARKINKGYCSGQVKE